MFRDGQHYLFLICLVLELLCFQSASWENICGEHLIRPVGDHRTLLKKREKRKIVKLNRELTGQKVYLKSADIEDTAYTYQVRQDVNRTKYMHAVTGGIESQKKWLENQIADKDSYFFVVRTKEGKPIGTYGLYDLDFQKKTGEIGRAILNGTPVENLEAIYLVHEFAYFDLELDKLYTECFEDNTAAVGVNTQVGGVEIGRNHMDGFGNLENIHFEITRENYLCKRAHIKSLVDRFNSRQ